MAKLLRALLLSFAWTSQALTGSAVLLAAGPFPDPLQSNDGSRVESTADWQVRRRPELLELFRRHVYGRLSGESSLVIAHQILSVDDHALGGKAIGKRVKITFRGPGGEGAIELSIYRPKEKTPVGCFLVVVNRRRTIIDNAESAPSPFWPVEQIIDRGYATAAFHYSDVAVDDPIRVFNHGVFKALAQSSERAPDAAGALAAWAWGASRAIDVLSADSSLVGCPIAVVGHSRGGKVALWCAANDERVALAISNDSGTTGAALARVSRGESIRHLTDHFPYWVAPNYRQFADRPDELPVDQHELLALIAPRLVYVASAAADAHADPAAEFRSCVEAGPVYRLFGLDGVGSSDLPSINAPRHSGAIGYHVRTGGHDLTAVDWNYFMDFTDHHWRRGERPAQDR